MKKIEMYEAENGNLITESLDFPEKTGEGRESRDEVDIILTQLAKHLTLAVNWAESAKEILKVT